MFRTIIYLILFILTIIFLFQNGSEPVTLKFLNFKTPTPIPVGFVFVAALLIGAVVVWLYHLPQIIILKRKVKILDRKITSLMEELKRKENEINEMKKKKEELESKFKEESLSEKVVEKTEEKKSEEKEIKEPQKRALFGFLKRKTKDEDKKDS